MRPRENDSLEDSLEAWREWCVAAAHFISTCAHVRQAVKCADRCLLVLRDLSAELDNNSSVCSSIESTKPVDHKCADPAGQCGPAGGVRGLGPAEAGGQDAAVLPAAGAHVRRLPQAGNSQVRNELANRSLPMSDNMRCGSAARCWRTCPATPSSSSRCAPLISNEEREVPDTSSSSGQCCQTAVLQVSTVSVQWRLPQVGAALSCT